MGWNYDTAFFLQVYKNWDMANESEEGEEREREEPIMFCREANLCGTVVETQYYKPTNNQGRGKRIHAKHICCHCYTDRNLAKIKDVEEREERRERPFHPIQRLSLQWGTSGVHERRKTESLG